MSCLDSSPSRRKSPDEVLEKSTTLHQSNLQCVQPLVASSVRSEATCLFRRRMINRRLEVYNGSSEQRSALFEKDEGSVLVRYEDPFSYQLLTANGNQTSNLARLAGMLSARCFGRRIPWLEARFDLQEKCRTAKPSGILEPANKQKLNCALPFRFSLSLGFFRFQGLNGISETPKDFRLSRRPTLRKFEIRISKFENSKAFLLRKEVIQPQVPLRLPCYDFIPVTAHSVGRCFPCGLARALRLQVTSMM